MEYVIAIIFLFGLGFFFGAKVFPVNEGQWSACVKICAPNEGVSQVRSTGHCWCKNGVEGSPP